jgi:arylsulfatase A-like enzyme
MDEAKANGWQVISMKDDWKRSSPPTSDAEARRRPGANHSPQPRGEQMMKQDQSFPPNRLRSPILAVVAMALALMGAPCSLPTTAARVHMRPANSMRRATPIPSLSATTLPQIAQRFGISVADLQAQNQLTSDQVVVGADAQVTAAGPAAAASVKGSKPNILLIVSDDHGYGDIGVYGGGEGRGMPTPNLDKMADEGMTFFSFYAQPSCTPGRAAMQTGRIPNRSGMTTVAFQGQGGGLPKAEWTLASVLKQAGYKTYFTGKWHLGEADYALPNAQGYDVMQYALLYHLNAYTYADPKWFPDMDPKLREMFQKVTKGALSGNAGEEAKQDWKVSGEYVDTPEKGVVGIPFLDKYVEQAGIGFLEDAAKNPDQPFFININFMKVHQPNLPAPEFEHKSLSKTKYADSVVELDARVGHVMDKLKELGLDKNTLVFYTTDNGAWQDVYPDAGYTPFRGTKGTVREGGNRVPAIAVWSGKIPEGVRNSDILGGLDLMATFASVAGIDLPTKDREGQPIIFDSYDMTPVLLGTGKSERTAWFYFTEDELSPGAARVGHYKAVFNLRGDDGQPPAGWPWTPTSAGRARRSTSPPSRRSSTSGRTRRSATTSS